MSIQPFFFGVLALLVGAAHFDAAAQAKKANVVFINGIQNTAEQAVISRNRLKEALSTSTLHIGSSQRTFDVTVVYNPMGGITNDNAELFLLKTAEECYRNDFGLIAVPHNQLRLIDRNAALRVKAYLENIVPGRKGGHNCGDAGMVDSGVVTAADMEATKAAALGLVERVKRDHPAVVVAHSQGNLLAHLGYSSLASDYGDEANKMMRVVNVANTSELSAHGLDLTHSGDRALMALRALPGTYLIFASRTTPDEPVRNFVCEA
jgi:hypothetical protein